MMRDPFTVGEAYLLSRPSLLSDSDLKRLPGLTGLSLDELLALPNLPPPMSPEVRARGRYWPRKAILAWWRQQHGRS